MAAPRFRVLRFDRWQDPSYAERLAREPLVELVDIRMAQPEEQSWAALASCHCYQASSARDELPKQWFVTKSLLERCPQLLCISTYGAGYDTIDVPACNEAGVLVVNQTGANAQSVAEHAIGMMLSLVHRISESDRRLRRERGFPREDLMGREVSGKTLGIVGLGNAGRRVARIAAALDMTILASDPYLTPEEVARRGATQVSLDELLERSDVVSVHCPRDPSTMRMFDARAYGRMKQGAVFLTTARGGIHDEAALHAALASGHLGGAGLDVWDVEPPPLEHPLLALDNVIATFHTAGVKVEARRNTASWGAEQVAMIAQGLKPPRIVNPEAWPAFAKRYEGALGRRFHADAPAAD